MQILKLFAVAVGLLFIFQAEAQSIGDAQVVGTGCSAKNVEVALTQNQTNLSVNLEGFAVEAGRTLGRRLDRKACQVSMPVQVPEGYQVSVTAVEYKGYTSVPAGGMARIEIETFLGESRGLQTEKVFASPYDDTYRSNISSEGDSLTWSACGQNFDLKVKTAMLVQSNNRMDSVTTVMNAADPAAKIQFNLQWRKCSKS